ncbi:hypothetical protein EJB05_44996, partial [Eragrostis curvula]
MPAIRVLTALDQARTQYYHFKAIVIAGMGLFTDSYDLFCITPVMKLVAAHDVSRGRRRLHPLRERCLCVHTRHPLVRARRRAISAPCQTSKMNPLMHMLLEESSSDDDDDLDDMDVVACMIVDYGKKRQRKRRGSVIGRTIVRRKRQGGHDKIWDDYFSEDPIYGHSFFHRRFRMFRNLFLRIAHAVEGHCDYFVQKRNATCELGHSCLKKVAVAICMLGTGCSADFIDDWLYMAESTNIESVRMSPLFAKLVAGEAAPVNFEVNGHQYDMGYYLADGIYPQSATFVKTIFKPQGNKRMHFAKSQESVRKGVERAFACIIMHNMILEDERGQDVDFIYETEGTHVPEVQPQRDEDRLTKFLEVQKKINNREEHHQLREDLVEHLWQRLGHRIRRRRRRLRPRASPSPLPTSPPPSAAAPVSPSPPAHRRRRFPARSPPRRARLPPRASPSPLPTSPPPSAAAPASLRPLTDAAPSPSTAAPRPPPYTRLAVAAPHRARLPPPPRPSLASASPTRCPSHSSSPRPASAPGAAAAAALSGAPASPPRRRHHR